MNPGITNEKGGRRAADALAMSSSKASVERILHVADLLLDLALDLVGLALGIHVVIAGRIADLFLDLAAEFPGRFRVVDGNRAEDAVAAEIQSLIAPELAPDPA